MCCGLPCPTCFPPSVAYRPKPGALGTCDRGVHAGTNHSHMFYDDSPNVKSVVEHTWK